MRLIRCVLCLFTACIGVGIGGDLGAAIIIVSIIVGFAYLVKAV